jgi:hypothetical protein
MTTMQKIRTKHISKSKRQQIMKTPHIIPDHETPRIIDLDDDNVVPETQDLGEDKRDRYA